MAFIVSLKNSQVSQKKLATCFSQSGLCKKINSKGEIFNLSCYKEVWIYIMDA